MNAAMVGASPVTVAEVDAKEQQLRSGRLARALPIAASSEGRQLRRWLTQQIVAQRLVAAEAAALGVTAAGAPTEDALLPDVSARLEIGSIAASTLADPLARSVFRVVTAAVAVTDAQVAAYHARNPRRFATAESNATGWRAPVSQARLPDVRAAIIEHLLAAARRRAFRAWLDDRSAQLVVLAPGYEHPGDPRQPDNTHKH
jgi:[acyl-carrier-protein] S-malonyltransferase